MGNHPSQTAKTISRSSASQKAGVLEITRQYPLMHLSTSLPWFIPARAPRANPRIPDNIQAITIKNSELDSLTAITLVTGWR